MDALVSTGTTIAFTYSFIMMMSSCVHTSTHGHHDSEQYHHHVFFETSGMLLLFVTMGKYFEAYAKGSTIKNMTSLLKLQPRQAILVTKGNEKYTCDRSNVIKSSNVNEDEDTEHIDVDLIQKGTKSQKEYTC